MAEEFQEIPAAPVVPGDSPRFQRRPPTEEEKEWLKQTRIGNPPISPGRPLGGLNRVSREARDFADSLLNSPEYRLSLYRRICEGTLDTSIEVMLWHYRFGKPKERIEVEMPQLVAALENMSTESLAKKADTLRQRIIDVKAQEDALINDIPEPQRASEEAHDDKTAA